MASIENTRLYRETVRAILEDWDNIMERDGTDTCPLCYRREYLGEESSEQHRKGMTPDFCDLCNEVFPEIVESRRGHGRNPEDRVCPCYALKDDSRVIERACAYVNDPEKEV